MGVRTAGGYSLLGDPKSVTAGGSLAEQSAATSGAHGADYSTMGLWGRLEAQSMMVVVLVDDPCR